MRRERRMGFAIHPLTYRGGCQRRRCWNIRTVFAALGILVKSTADPAGRIVGRFAPLNLRYPPRTSFLQ